MIMLKNKKIQIAPTDQELYNATMVIVNWNLHYYQLLYFNELIHPNGSNGRPFKLEFSYDKHPRLKVISTINSEYLFNISKNPADKLTQEKYDAVVLNNCALITKAIQAGKTKVNKYACCGLSIPQHCVCSYSGICELHGESHHGTHD